MIFRFLSITILLLATYRAFSQDTTGHPAIKRNTVFIEGGYRSGYTLNYDRLLIIKGKWQVSARGGFGFYYNPYDKTRIPYYYNSFDRYQLSIPFGINILYGKHTSHLEIGVNANIAILHTNSSYYLDEGEYINNNSTLTQPSRGLITNIETRYFINTYLSGISIGYRYQKSTGGIFFSTGIKPVLSNFRYKGYSFIEDMLPYANIGYTF